MSESTLSRILNGKTGKNPDKPKWLEVILAGLVLGKDGIPAIRTKKQFAALLDKVRVIFPHQHVTANGMRWAAERAIRKLEEHGITFDSDRQEKIAEAIQAAEALNQSLQRCEANGKHLMQTLDFLTDLDEAISIENAMTLKGLHKILKELRDFNDLEAQDNPPD